MSSPILQLDAHSSILEEAIGSRLVDGRREPCEISFADFDDVLFKLVVLPGSESVMTLNMAMPTFADIEKFGGRMLIQKVYGGQVTTPEQMYQFALKVDCDTVKDDKDAAGVILTSWMNVKRNLVSAPFVKAFEALNGDQAKHLPFMEVPFRKTESAFIAAASDQGIWDRVNVALTFDFSDETDRAYARIFIQGFVDCARKVNNTPPMVFYETKVPPKELGGHVKEKNVPSTIMGYLVLTIFTRHIKTPERMNKTIDALIGMRNYIHFHIKAAKTNLHMRMRRKVVTWLQVLNRAIMTNAAPKDMKTATGKTFTRKISQTGSR